jgi:hypothetical protein
MPGMRSVVIVSVPIASAALTCAVVLALAPRSHCEVEPTALVTVPIAPAPTPPPAPPSPPIEPPPFDALACTTAPPVVKKFVLHDHRELATAAHAIAATLPAAWHAHVELDATGMASVVDLHVRDRKLVANLGGFASDLVRAHACLFGVIAPDAIAITVHDPDGGTWLEISAPPSGGFIVVTTEPERGATAVHVAQHAWPIRPRDVAIDPLHAFARYLGRKVVEWSGHRMLVDPVTHERLGCVPIRHEQTTDLSSLHWRTGAVIACHDRIGEVRDGIALRTTLNIAPRDEVFATLPAVLAPDGTPLADTLAPRNDLNENDVGSCPIPSPK